MVELLVVIAIIALLLTIILAVGGKVRGKMRTTECISNLRQIATAFRLYAQDNMQRLPEPAIANRSWEQIIQPYYGGKFACPADQELARTVGSSYDWRDTGDPVTSFAGKLLSAIGPADAVLAFEVYPGWHTPRQMNVVRLDGSCTSLDQDACANQLIRPITPANGATRP